MSKEIIRLLLDYEISGSRWARNIWWKWGQNLAGTYYAHKVMNKYRRMTETNRKRVLEKFNRHYDSMMMAYSAVGQYREQRDALMKAALKAKTALKLTALIDKTSASDDAANALSEALLTVNRVDQRIDPMMQQRDELLAAIGKLKPGYSAEEFAELASVYHKVKGGTV